MKGGECGVPRMFMQYMYTLLSFLYAIDKGNRLIYKKQLARTLGVLC